MENKNIFEINAAVESVCISARNSKMREVPSVSLPPVKTCAAGVPCAKKCYALKLAKFRPTVRESYERNYRICLENPALFWLQVRAAIAMTRFFRFHVGGDIPDPAYFDGMVQSAIMFPGCQILAFTKQYDIVNNWIRENGELPENLHIIFSGWGDGWKVENPYNLPESNVIFKKQEPRDGWKVCGGNCAACACRGTGCWTLGKGETIAFYEH